MPAYGGKPATKFVASLGAEVLTSTGHIRVKPNLELPDYPHVFSLGDAIDWDEAKQIVSVLAQVPILVANIKSILAAQAPAKEYKGAMKALLITNGRVSTCFLVRNEDRRAYRPRSIAACSMSAFSGALPSGTGSLAGSRVALSWWTRLGRVWGRSPERRVL